jgi:V8-like Glu-specific endopeptidase
MYKISKIIVFLFLIFVGQTVLGQGSPRSSNKKRISHKAKTVTKEKIVAASFVSSLPHAVLEQDCNLISFSVDEPLETTSKTQPKAIPETQKQLENTVIQSVFMLDALPETKGEYGICATGFLVGQNLLITNKHVIEGAIVKELSKSSVKQINMAIKRLKVYSRFLGKYVPVLKLEYYKSGYDVCFLRLGSMDDGCSANELLPSLKLNTEESSLHAKTWLGMVGNPECKGLKASSDYFVNTCCNGLFLHCVPTFRGSSGSPIFNSKGEVVAINTGALALESHCKFSKGHTGAGISMAAILSELCLSNPKLYAELVP